MVLTMLEEVNAWRTRPCALASSETPTQLAREAKRAEASLAGVGTRAHTISTALGTAFGTVAGRGIAAVAGAATRAVGSIGALASTSIQAASDMNESLSKNQAVFGASAGAVKDWATTARRTSC
jgi:hypothetical protein